MASALGSFEIVKAGWVHRQSTILKRWKRSWLVLYTDSMLKYFDSPDCHMAEDCLAMSKDATSIKTNAQCMATPPEGLPNTCLFVVVKSDGERWVFCAESNDDATAWYISLEQARAMMPARPASVPPPYSSHGVFSGRSYPGVVHQRPSQVVQNGQTIYCPSPGQQIQTVHVNGQQVQFYVNPGDQQGQTTIIYADDPYYHRHGRHCGCRRCNGLGMGTGLLAGAALGSMMMWPLFW